MKNNDLLVLFSHRRYCLCFDVTLIEGDSPSPIGFDSAPVHYISGVFDITAHNKEVEVVRCLHQQGMVFDHLLA
jgi:hypothetical protein